MPSDLKEIAQVTGIEPARPEAEMGRWKAPRPGDPMAKPIDYLVPGSDLHSKVLEYALKRLTHSEREMSKFYDRWRFNEQRLQAYINHAEYEKLLKRDNDLGKPAKAVSIVVPYAWATTMTIVTYMLMTFCGRKPIFQIGSLNADATEAAVQMELMLQYNADHTRLVRHLFQNFQDAETYGVSILGVQWLKESAMRTVWKTTVNPMSGAKLFTPSRARRTVYEGNTVRSIDPFMFFPDPRVPMSEVASRGEYVFWRTFEGLHLLKRLESNGDIKYVDAAGNMPRASMTGQDNPSARAIRTLGDATPGSMQTQASPLPTDFKQVDQGTIEIVPKELGLGDSTTPQKWLITILNKRQIVQCAPFEMDHGKHPVVVSEPYTMGYGFGQLGSIDLIGPFQDLISWFINAHVANVRTALNNMLVVDPSRVEMQDVMNPDAGKLIRLKRSAYGQDVKDAVYQLQVVDVTGNHMNDLELLMRLADTLTGVNDNMRGTNSSGGRKTATEVRSSWEGGSSRLAANARLRSAQSMVELAEMMCLNVQQLMSEEFEFQVMGMADRNKSIRVSPEHLTGDFYFPVNDGTLPIDKVAQLDIWKEMFLTIAQDPNLAQQYDVPKLFEWVAELGGARNVERFKLQVMPNEQVAAGAQAGNLVPVSDAMNGAKTAQPVARNIPSAQPSNALPKNPAGRLVQGPTMP